jgi:nucleoside-diphosphate-sugar epimerase
VYPSSVAAYGPPDGSGRPRTAADPLRPTDAYTHHKAACEAIVTQNALSWCVLRLGVAVGPGDLRRVDPVMGARMLRTHPDNPLEWIHPRDAGLALARAAVTAGAAGRVLPVGGGPGCQVRQRDLLAAVTDAVGLPRIPDAALGQRPYYTDWLDTEESQALLGYQRHRFDDLRAELRRALAGPRAGLALLGWPLRVWGGGNPAAGRGGAPPERPPGATPPADSADALGARWPGMDPPVRR